MEKAPTTIKLPAQHENKTPISPKVPEINKDKNQKSKNLTSLFENLFNDLRKIKPAKSAKSNGNISNPIQTLI